MRDNIEQHSRNTQQHLPSTVRRVTEAEMRDDNEQHPPSKQQRRSGIAYKKPASWTRPSPI